MIKWKASLRIMKKILLNLPNRLIQNKNWNRYLMEYIKNSVMVKINLINLQKPILLKYYQTLKPINKSCKMIWYIMELERILIINGLRILLILHLWLCKIYQKEMYNQMEMFKFMKIFNK